MADSRNEHGVGRDGGNHPHLLVGVAFDRLCSGGHSLVSAREAMSGCVLQILRPWTNVRTGTASVQGAAFLAPVAVVFFHADGDFVAFQMKNLPHHHHNTDLRTVYLHLETTWVVAVGHD